MSKIISILSGKGGVGKSTFAVGLGLSLANMNKKVIIIEMDVGLRTIDIILGMQNQIVYDLGDLLSNKCDPDEAIINYENNNNLYFISASVENNVDLLEQDIIFLCDELKNYYDYIILDSCFNIEKMIEITSKIVDIGLVISTVDNISVRNAGQIVNTLYDKSFNNLKLIINKINVKNPKQLLISDLDKIIDLIGINLLGTLMIDEELYINFNLGKPDKIVKSKVIFDNIARRIQGEYIPLNIK